MLGAAEAEAARTAIRDRDLSRGPAVARFEDAFSRYMGGGHAASVSSGTAAIEVAVRALGLAGAEVVTGAMSCQSTANALLAAGCRLRFADHDPETWQVAPESVERAITGRTKAIVIAHLYGNASDPERLATIARRRGIMLIEDCAQSLGARWNGRMVGTFGAASVYSFYANKMITTGEGGMVWARSARVAKRASIIRNFGQSSPFRHEEYGLNWKMPNLLAAIGIAQLGRVHRLLAARRARANLLRRLLGEHAGIVLPMLPSELAPAPFCFPLVIRGKSAAMMRRRLARRGVETRPLFPPQFDQPSWRALGIPSEKKFPVARRLAAQGLYLPTSPHLSRREIAEIAEIFVEEFDA